MPRLNLGERRENEREREEEGEMGKGRGTKSGREEKGRKDEPCSNETGSKLEGFPIEVVSFFGSATAGKRKEEGEVSLSEERVDEIKTEPSEDERVRTWRE